MSGAAHVVFGATGGIGSALARGLADTGGRVILVARNEDRLRSLAEQTGGETHAVDVTDAGAVRDLVEDVADRYTLRSASNCVGSILLKPAHLTTEDDFQSVLDVNLKTAFNTVRAAAPALREAGGGSIVLFGSAAGRIGLPNHEAIAAAKAGVAGLTRAAAATYAPAGVRVNCVSPGLVDTPLSERITRNEKARKHSEAMHPLGRLGRPDEVARTALWLLGDDAGWVTGQEIGVDGGLARVRTG